MKIIGMIGLLLLLAACHASQDKTLSDEVPQFYIIASHATLSDYVGRTCIRAAIDAVDDLEVAESGLVSDFTDTPLLDSSDVRGHYYFKYNHQQLPNGNGYMEVAAQSDEAMTLMQHYILHDHKPSDDDQKIIDQLNTRIYQEISNLCEIAPLTSHDKPQLLVLSL